MNNHFKRFLKSQIEVNWRRVLHSTLAILLAALLAGPLDVWVSAQQQEAILPFAAAGIGMLVTTTTSVTSAVIAVKQGGAGTASSDHVTGSHNIFGYAANGTTVCFLQIFDRYPAAAISVGTTVPLTSIVVDSSSARGFTIYPLPVFSITSALGMASATTATGSSACVSPVIVQFAYK